MKPKNDMLEFERGAYTGGHLFVAGTDEAGRGPLAGPVVAAAVILPVNFELEGLNDSKQLSAKKLVHFYGEIQKQAIAIGVSIVDVETIDKINIYQAAKQAMVEAVSQLSTQPTYILSDAMPFSYDDAIVEPIIKGDQRSISVAAASVVAKVTRDQLMCMYDLEYPEYGFAAHKGYGTKAHLLALETYGVTPIHRKTFAPVKKLIDGQLHFDV
ncbi:ribonuclease HII [Culicoidibacter larvae]|uniref:Ribonuclease HII n=1 Tax=Culicoidibacter larvae TaxID=2579976 RepID=A0A5R8QA86_9FIRM|nr:ribonuclease HII [Culicoidibacter larvae]TLG72559.1 ribonuclease HII [Culicoidibacter larvae]